MKSFAALKFAALAGVMLASQAVAQIYPTKPIRVVVPFPPGAGQDFLARAVGQPLGEALGQVVVVDNRAGGNTIVGAEVVARAAPDGYTILHALDFTMTLNPSVYGNLSYEPLRDFIPVSQLTSGMAAIMTHPKTGITTLKDLVAHAKRNPGKLNFAASAVSTQLLGEVLKSSSGIDMVFVPYKGTAAMVQALLAGQIDLVFDGVPVYGPHIREGRMVGLGVTGSSRFFQLPDMPTVAEAGFPELTFSNWSAWFLPAGAPQPIVTRLNNEIGKALSNSATKDRLNKFGFELQSSTSEELRGRIREELARWRPVVKAAGIKPE